jgi:hypothetical protein
MAMRKSLQRATTSATECGLPDAMIIALAKVAQLFVLSSLMCFAESLILLPCIVMVFPRPPVRL